MGTINQAEVILASFLDESDKLVDPTTLSVVLTQPDGATVNVDPSEVTRTALGVYQYILLPELAGRWVVRFLGDRESISEIVWVFPNDWVPTADDIGARSRMRTKDVEGNELGVFTSATDPTPSHRTRPSLEQVNKIITEEVGAMTAYFGESIPQELYMLAHSAATARIAARIEEDYFAQEMRADRSPYPEYVADRDREEGRLEARLRELSPQAIGPGGGGMIGSLHTRTPAAIAADAAWTLPVYPYGYGNQFPPDYWPADDQRPGEMVE